MLVEFIEQCENMTAPELEQQFQDCASLFLARLTAWLRLSLVTNIYNTVEPRHSGREQTSQSIVYTLSNPKRGQRTKGWVPTVSFIQKFHRNNNNPI